VPLEVDVLAALIVGMGVLGLIIGSFLNVVIYRIPLQESLVRPGSHCPSCGKELQARDNIPVVSFLLLRGRCRNCGEPISIRYPLTELITGALFAATAGKFGFSWHLPAYLALGAGLIALSEIDLERWILPRRIVFGTGVVTLALLCLASGEEHNWHRLLVGLACGATWFLLLFGLHSLNNRIMGFGDVRLAAVLGLALGWLGLGYAVLGFFAANVVGAVVGVGLMVAGKASRRSKVPYGPFLAIGCELAVFFGSALLASFRGA
jgi:leader peptidase (prepilin peptidase) / N-methyltransferase